jgi:hypothetical protein
MEKPIPYTSVLIDPSSDLQVHHWAKDMQIQPHELRTAVGLVGPRLSDIRQYFGIFDNTLESPRPSFVLKTGENIEPLALTVFP